MAAGAMFTGSGQQLDKLMKDQLFGIKTVSTIDYVGYSKEYACYVYGDIAIKDGTTYKVNSEDYFEFGKLRLKTLQKSIAMHIQRDNKEYRTDWLPMLWLCFGAKGIVALAFWFGSLFVFRVMAKSDSKMRHVYLRHRRYKPYYPARSTPFRDNPPSQGSQYK